MCGAATTGIISMNINGEARLYVPSKLSPNERVRFQYPDKTGATRCCLTRDANAFELVETETDSAASDALAGNPVFGYRMKQVAESIGKAPFVGAAVVGRSLKVEQANTQSLRVSVPKQSLTISTCTSQEGLHVVTKSGRKVLSDLYLGFDYEVANPTCRVD
jgi:hypothetical protein